MSSTSSTRRKLVVVGAGPIGCLAAMAFAKRGWRVDLYEGRPGQWSYVVFLFYFIFNPSGAFR